MEIRQLVGEEVDRQFYLWAQAFENGDRTMTEWRAWDMANADRREVYGIFGEGGLEATFVNVGMEMHMGESILPISAVYGVAVLPAARGKGYASTGVRYLLERMRERGQWVSILEPFSWEFYGNLGYALVGAIRRYAVAPRLLKPSEDTAFVRAASPTGEDREKIVAAYTRMAGRYRGMIRRTEWEWGDILNDRPDFHTFNYVYERDGVVEGYLSHREGSREEMRLRELLCLTPRAQRGLLGLLRRMEMQTKKVAWYAPYDDLLWTHFYHWWELETKLKPLTMARIVDVQQALQAVRPDKSLTGKLILSVTDRDAPWNAGNWRIELADGHCTVTATTESPDVGLSIQTLAQAYCGTPTLHDLCRAEQVVIHERSAFDLLGSLLDGPPYWVNDTF